MPLKKLITATRSCKICHRKIEENSFFSMVFTPKSICLRCFLSLKPSYLSWRERKVSFLAIYPYQEAYQNLLYLYKGCGDVELAPCFLERIAFALRIRFRGYRIVYAPSHPNKVLERGFEHIPLMFECLKLPILHAFIKTQDIKQSDQSKSERKKIGKYLRLVDDKEIEGQKILLVDDVFTTGSTMRACIALLQEKHPKRIHVLVLSKVPKHVKNAKAHAGHANRRA